MEELFERLSAAQSALVLKEEEKKNLIFACQTEKPKKKASYKPFVAAAAVLILILGICSPGFILQAGTADGSSNEIGAALEDLEDFDEKQAQESAEFYNDAAAGATGFRLYRDIYYRIPEQFSSLVGEEEFELWVSEDNTGNRMPIVAFVEHFGISKEAFDEANRLYAEEIAEKYSVTPLILPADYPEQENYEVFNSDIICCGDDEKISEYYAAANYPYENEEKFIASGEKSEAIEYEIN